MRTFEVSGTLIEILMCDITEERVEAIVNAANSYLSHGGGVALAILMKGGPVIDSESMEYVEKFGPIKTGNVAITSGGRLHAKYVIHAVGPVWEEENGDCKLSMAFYNSLLKADEIAIKSISFPAISSGIYGFPTDRCAKIFYETVNRYFSEKKSQIRLVRMCLYSDSDLKIFEKIFDGMNQ